MEIEMFVDFDCLEKKELENLQEFENQDLERSLEFENLDLDLDFESLEIVNFGYLDFEES